MGAMGAMEAMGAMGAKRASTVAGMPVVLPYGFIGLRSKMSEWMDGLEWITIRLS